MFIFSSTDHPNEQWSMIKLAQFSAPRAFTALIVPARFFWPTRKRILRTMKFCEPPKLTLLCVITMPSPGAVCPARVQFLRLTRKSDARRISPLTSNTMVIGSSLYCWNAQRRVPSDVLSARLVTLTTLPPRPPVAYLPKPSAVGNARGRCDLDTLTGSEVTPWRETAATL